uniref:Hpc2-related domain-containing protein n=1 Tax=Leersia perrieri TaxID=77586 RepID=A0A0D9WGP6_9ORYZ
MGGEPVVAPRALAAPVAVAPKPPPEGAVAEAEGRVSVAAAHRGGVAPPPPPPAVATGSGRGCFPWSYGLGRPPLCRGGRCSRRPVSEPACHPLRRPRRRSRWLAPFLDYLTHPTENDRAQSNRFNAVIEKIERLYMGKNSSDEEDLDDVPDDDQYDTEDSFIDDDELDEYFEADNLATKHNGYFVNKGKLEQIESGSVQTVEPKKRRRKDSSNSYIENNNEFASGPSSYMGMPLKDSKRGTMQTGKGASNAPERIQQRNFSDPATDAEYAAHLNISSKDVHPPPSEIKEFDEHNSGANETYGHPYPGYWDKDGLGHLGLQQKKTSNGANQDLPKNMRPKEKYNVGHFSDLNAASNMYTTETMHLATKSRLEGSSIKTKGTRLERAIRDLQNIVTEYKPQILDVHEAEENCQVAVKRRLPQEVKQKLAKVARLSANQGKIPEHELINRLMGIVGHLVHRRTLKRNMKEMVQSGLFAKQEKAWKLQQVKMEIYEMVKARLATQPKGNEHKDEFAESFQGSVTSDDRRALRGKYVMDAVLEDRICDLYDLYVEGMDEDKGPQSRKLYLELADLWPQGHMDKVGIRDAISRSKERRNILYRQRKVRNDQRMRRRLAAAAAKLRDRDPAAPQIMQQSIKVSQPSMTDTDTTYPVVNYGHGHSSRNAEKIRERSVGAGSDSNRSSTDMKRRKIESEDRQVNPPKADGLHHGIEIQKPAKRAEEAKVSTLSQALLAIPSSERRPSCS